VFVEQSEVAISEGESADDAVGTPKEVVEIVGDVTATGRVED
jgi:hypothetical protein